MVANPTHDQIRFASIPEPPTKGTRLLFRSRFFIGLPPLPPAHDTHNVQSLVFGPKRLFLFRVQPREFQAGPAGAFPSFHPEILPPGRFISGRGRGDPGHRRELRGGEQAVRTRRRRFFFVRSHRGKGHRRGWVPRDRRKCCQGMLGL